MIVSQISVMDCGSGHSYTFGDTFLVSVAFPKHEWSSSSRIAVCICSAVNQSDWFLSLSCLLSRKTLLFTLKFIAACVNNTSTAVGFFKCRRVPVMGPSACCRLQAPPSAKPLFLPSLCADYLVLIPS